MSLTRMSDWTRIADRAGVAEFSGVLDLEAPRSKDRGVLPRIVVALTLAACLGLAGCQGDEPAVPAASGIQAFPDPPHVDGPVVVELRPALPAMTGDRRCRPGGTALLCSSDGSGGYHALGSSGPVVVDEVSTMQSEDHTSWETTVRFAAESRGAVRRARDLGAAVGGVVVVVVTIGGDVVAVLEPADVTPRSVTRLGLQKTEAWSIVDGFSR
jgi:hypothetical protein